MRASRTVIDLQRHGGINAAPNFETVLNHGGQFRGSILQQVVVEDSCSLAHRLHLKEIAGKQDDTPTE